MVFDGGGGGGANGGEVSTELNGSAGVTECWQCVYCVYLRLGL